MKKALCFALAALVVLCAVGCSSSSWWDAEHEKRGVGTVEGITLLQGNWSAGSKTVVETTKGSYIVRGHASVDHGLPAEIWDSSYLVVNFGKYYRRYKIRGGS